MGRTEIFDLGRALSAWRSVWPIETFGFLALPAANGVAGTEMSYGFISFSLIFLKVFNHLLEFRI
jgi:hypothetical protein